MWASVLEAFELGYTGFFEKYGDPRQADKFLLDTPGRMILIDVLYLLFCLKIGPAIMKNRKPLELKTPMFIYNVVMVVSCTLAIIQAFRAGFASYSWTCQATDYSYSREGLMMAQLSQLGFYMKLVELLDTIFFVLRKKDNQVTFLHVYHHAFMPVFTWTIARFYPGGHMAFPSLLNTVVHIVMYSYYLLASMGPHFQKYIWWKVYLTKFQLIQFAIMTFQQAIVLVNGCPIPKFLPLVGTFHAVFFFVLFAAFYIRTYIATQKAKKS